MAARRPRARVNPSSSSFRLPPPRAQVWHARSRGDGEGAGGEAAQTASALTAPTTDTSRSRTASNESEMNRCFDPRGDGEDAMTRASCLQGYSRRRSRTGGKAQIMRYHRAQGVFLATSFLGSRDSRASNASASAELPCLVTPEPLAPGVAT